MTIDNYQIETDWQQFPGLSGIEDGHLEQLSRREIGLLLYQMAVIRIFEEWLLENESLAHGPIHSSIGQEAVAVGAVAGLQHQDTITSTHRAHHHVLAKVLSCFEKDDFDPISADAPSDSVVEGVYRTMSEILGLADGWAGGRGGSMHLSVPEAGVLATSAIVGGGIPVAAGAALAAKMREQDAVSLAFFGDGACSIGAFHEGISMARACRIPALFVIDNNQYSVATTVVETVGFDDIVIRAAGQSMRGILVDGMDPAAVRSAVAQAREFALEESNPVLIEAKTYRFFHQAGGLPGSAFRYRTEAEEEHWKAKDPIDQLPRTLLEEGLLVSGEIDKIMETARQLVLGVADRCTESDGPDIHIPDRLLPDRGSEFFGLVSEGKEFDGRNFVEPEELELDQEVSYQDAISRVIHRSMERDPEVFVLGEEVGHLRGGAYGCTRHALRSFPDRVLSTPIAENGFCGVALGAAMVGMKPIVEIMFPDFALEAADQLFNHIPKTRYMFGGDLSVPLVARTRTAQGRGYGPQHSSDPAALFALFPGWRILAPSSPVDYVGLFNTALISEDPVLIIEHHELWPMKGMVPSSDLDYMIPFGKARMIRAGSELTVATWSHPLHRVRTLADELEREGISIEILDLRCLDRESLDVAAIVESVERTGALAIVEDATVSHSVGVHISDLLYPEVFGLLRHPIARITGKDVHIPVSRHLEESALLDDSDIMNRMRELAR